MHSAGKNSRDNTVTLFEKNRIDAAYWKVARELQGEGVTDALLDAVQFSFKEALTSGDNRKAGRLLTDALEGIEWDWPRWYAHAKTTGHDTVADIHQWVSRLTAKDLMDKASKAELIGLAAKFGLTVKATDSKPVLIEQLGAVSRTKLKPALNPVAQQLLKKELLRCRRSMGLFVASRVSHLIYNDFRYQQLLEPGHRAVLPFWQFICVPDASKNCRSWNKKILPAAEAFQRFPTLPCDVLNCRCRINSLRTAKG